MVNDNGHEPLYFGEQALSVFIKNTRPCRFHRHFLYVPGN